VSLEAEGRHEFAAHRQFKSPPGGDCGDDKRAAGESDETEIAGDLLSELRQGTLVTRSLWRIV